MLLSKYGTGTQSSIAQAIDLDGTNDYLSRASDLTGNADGKTFTFSVWVYWDAAPFSGYLYFVSGGYFYIQFSNANTLVINGINAAGAGILNANVAVAPLLKTWNHILVSVDLANAANRSVYINDVAQTVTWGTYVNDSIDFTRSTHGVGASDVGGSPIKGRLAHVYLDKTYRDLSNSTNRRLFITADRKPVSKASLQALNGLVYLPMDDPSTAHVNLGTGGNFTLNGTIARSGRGPNQFNAAYSDLDGAADYLSRTTAPTGIADSKAFTTHFVFNADAAGNAFAHYFTTAGAARFIATPCNVNKAIRVQAYNAAGTVILDLLTANNSIALSRNHVVGISIDLSDTAKRHVYINGTAASVTWLTYTNDTIQFNLSSTPKYHIGANNTPAGYFDGRLGEVFFHTSYIDLSVASNLAKFVIGTGIDAKPADLGANGELPLGTSPLIYLPMYGNDAGNNRGTGGAFTVNSGPYTGARGPSEFWGNKADFDGSTGYLERTGALAGAVDGKTVSLSFWINSDGPLAGGDTILSCGNGSSQWRGINLITSTTALRMTAYNASGVKILDVDLIPSYSAGASYFVQVSIDLANAANRAVYVNGVAGSPSWNTYTNDTIAMSSATSVRLGGVASGTSGVMFNGKLAEFFATTEYISFSQEANRLKFRDAFGNPVDLGPQGKNPTGNQPAIYLRFDPSNKGANAGYGGNFTPTGTINDAGQL